MFARSMEPPWPMHSTLSAASRRSAAAIMSSGRMRDWVSRIASISTLASLEDRSGTESSGWISPDRGSESARAAVAAAMASRKALYPR